MKKSEDQTRLPLPRPPRKPARLPSRARRTGMSGQGITPIKVITTGLILSGILIIIILISLSLGPARISIKP
jgi:hypothetical protein